MLELPNVKLNLDVTVSVLPFKSIVQGSAEPVNVREEIDASVNSLIVTVSSPAK